MYDIPGLDDNKPEVIVMVGMPGSGKSFFANDVLAAKQYEIVNRDTLGTWQKCVDRVNDYLKAGKKVVVDNTNGTKVERARYAGAAKTQKVPCRCFVMSTSHQHVLHNIAFRQLTDTKHSKINEMIINTYRKNYQEPESGEGFTEIVTVDLIPKFTSEKDRLLYCMHLVSNL